MICAPSEDSDQTTHPSSLTRVFAVRSVGSYKDPRFLNADSDVLDQIWRMPRLSEYLLGEQMIWLDLSWSRNVQVNCKVCPQYISYCKIAIFF